MGALERTKNKISDIMLRAELDGLNRRVRQLECKHENVEFLRNHYYNLPEGHYYCLRCKDCDRLLESFETKDEMLIAEAKHHKDKYLEIVDHNEEVRKAVED